MRWRIKALVQKGVSKLPEGDMINYWMGRRFSFTGPLNEQFVNDRLRMFRWHRQIAENLEKPDLKVLEIGTGWFPLIPISFMLTGGNHIVTTDVRQLFSKHSIDLTIDTLVQLHREERLDSYIGSYERSRIIRLIEARDLPKVDDKWAKLGIQFKNSSKGWKGLESADLIVSNNTFQYIPENRLPQLYRESHQLLSEGGRMSLGIDLVDEFSASDPTIGPFNFLKFTDEEWERFTCRFNRTNRVRYEQYLDLIDGLFEIESEQLIKSEEGEVEFVCWGLKG